jgi:phosphoribosylamine--glycine ligase
VKILVIGGGGREHALAWKIRQSPLVDEVFVAPGNAGTAAVGRNLEISVGDIEGLLDSARAEGIDLTVVGPEVPLMEGVVDRFQAEGLLIFGPKREPARIEGSKSFAKSLMDWAGVPTAGHQAFSKREEALAYVGGLPPGGLVVKADGLAAGKGVMVCSSTEEAEEALRRLMGNEDLGAACEKVVVEERLFGKELSVFSFCDGARVVLLGSAQDYKPIGDGDTGPNTGGMGAYSPVPWAGGEFAEEIVSTRHRPVAQALSEQGTPYQGMLYGGLMITEAGPKVLEFNARFGDPETQPLLLRLGEDLLPWLLATAEGKLKERKIRLRKEAAVCVVMASQGYPGKYETGKEISGLDEVAEREDVAVFHAGTVQKGNRVLTAGGRVLGVTALGKDLGSARSLAYEAVSKISFEGAYVRKDIGEIVAG